MEDKGWKVEEFKIEETAETTADCDPGRQSDWEAAIEAVLFTMGNPVELSQLAAAIGQCEGIAQQVTEKLQERYRRENRGMQIIALEDSYQMTTKAEFYENLIRVAATPKKQILTEVVLETLSIIAYKQPVTKTEISRIRGVSSDHAVNRLVEYGLVYEAGRMDAPGRPALFATTDEFLRRFGLGSTTDLPTILPEEEAEIEQEVEEELRIPPDEMTSAETGSNRKEPDDDSRETGEDTIAGRTNETSDGEIADKSQGGTDGSFIAENDKDQVF